MKNIQLYLELVRKDPHLRNLFNETKDLVEFPIFPENHEKEIFGDRMEIAHGSSLRTRIGESDEGKKIKPYFPKQLFQTERNYFYAGRNAKIQRPNQDMIKLIEGLGKTGKLENYLTSFLESFGYSDAEKSMAKEDFNQIYEPKRDRGVYGSFIAFKDALYEFSVLESKKYLGEDTPSLVSLKTEKLAKPTGSRL